MSVSARDLEQITRTLAETKAVPHPNDAVARPPVACSLRDAHSALIARLAGVPVPRLPVDVDPDDIRDVTPYLLMVAKHCDDWLKEVADELKGNGVSFTEREFRDVVLDQFVGALDGNITVLIENAALAMEEDRGRE